MLPRKRAPTACRFCRSRRIKCDNVRPSCGSCLVNRVTCNYSDGPLPLVTGAPTTGQILDRINYIASLLESGAQTPPAPAQPGLFVDGPYMNSTSASASYGQNLSSIANFSDREIDHEFSEKMDIPGAVLSCESIIHWRIFDDVVEGDIGTLLFNSNILSKPYSNPRGHESSINMTIADDSQPGRSKSRHAISEDDILPLCNRFLAVVHARNPILDIPDFKRQARYVAEYGIGWNVDSCLVLFACALASVSDSFRVGNETPDLHTSPVSTKSYQDIKAGEDYYFAARKRLGLLETSLETVQCLMLAGNYEMHILNPIRGWFYFNQACVQLQALLWTKSARYAALDDRAQLERTRRVEQRLYWSCVRFECELRAEIPLPPSGIMSLDFSDPFPSPPSGVSQGPDDATVIDPSGFQVNLQRNITEDEQESWFYYLAETAFRKTANRVLRSMYSQEPQSWISNIDDVLKQVAEFTEHINLWISHIPPQLRWQDGEVPTKELSFLLRSRALLCLEWIHRPCLYYAIHQPANDPHMAQVFPLAQRCLQIVMDSAASLLNSYMYRHGGSWSAARSAFRSSLLILATARSGSIQPPPHWKLLVEQLVQVLAYWEQEANDVKQARSIVERIYSDTCARAESIR